MRTTPGLAIGTQTDTVPYDDSTAILSGTWGPDQTAQATVYTVNQDSNLFEEVELRLRTSISAHSITGYEFNFRCTPAGTQYVQIVRWNGPFDNFTLLDSRGGPGLKTGDVVSATAVGSTLSAYINGTLIVQVTDTTFTSGSPGLGFYIQNGTAAQESDYGFIELYRLRWGGSRHDPAICSCKPRRKRNFIFRNRFELERFDGQYRCSWLPCVSQQRANCDHYQSQLCRSDRSSRYSVYLYCLGF